MGGSTVPDSMQPMKGLLHKYAGPAAKVWLVLKVLGIVTAVFSFAIWATNSTRLAAIENVSSDFSQVSSAQGELIRRTEAIISSTYQTNNPPGPADLTGVRESAGAVLASLSGFEAPSRSLRRSRDAYRVEVERLIGSVNSYDGSVERYEAFQDASVRVANIGGEFRSSVEKFTGSTWHSFWSVW